MINLHWLTLFIGASVCASLGFMACAVLSIDRIKEHGHTDHPTND